MSIEIKKLTLANGESVAYREAGKKVKEPILIFIHGNQSSSLIFESFMEGFEKEARMFAIDLPGFGGSSYNTPHESLMDWAEDVVQFMDKKKIASASVLGWSAGGGIAMELAASYPERVEQLILSSSIGVKGITVLGKNPLKRAARLEKREEIAEDPYIVAANQAIEEKNAKYFHFLWDEIIFNIEDPADPVFDAYVQEILKQRCFTDLSVALCQFDITPNTGSGRIANIKSPVTWIQGKMDLVVPIDVVTESLRYFASSTEMIPIYDAGHAAFIDQPEIYAEILCGII